MSFPLESPDPLITILRDPLKAEYDEQHGTLHYHFTDGVWSMIFTMSLDDWYRHRDDIVQKYIAAFYAAKKKALGNPDDELDMAKLIVRRKWPLAYQDGHGNIWTDDLYNCDSHCLVASEGSSRAAMRATWIEAARRIKMAAV